MQEYYAARASEYDRIYAKPERQSDLRMIEQWLPGVYQGANVLEIACGTGYWTQFFAPLAKRVMAIDSSPETMEIAASRVPQDKVEFVVGDAYALPQVEPKFDAAFAGFWFSHVPKSRVPEFLGGLNARLKPGARVVLLDNRYVEGSSTRVSAADANGDTWQSRPLDDGSSHQVLKNFPTERELHDAVEGLASHVTYHQWQYFWGLEYVVAG
ncbi:class I SAM-dependent methyltransferase [Pseudomonas sp. NA-150]|uniref:class I SAM-dependent methyltransferase n=1 Tax=Pseudomonas sp. NA-150 TaxID=3367525 RepID=UPI0037CA2809